MLYPKGAESGNGDAIPSHQARLYPLEEGIQGTRRLRPRQTRVQCDLAN